MKTFLYFTGLISAIFVLAWTVATLITMGWPGGFCYAVYLVGLVIIGVIAHFVNDRLFGYDDYYLPSAGYDAEQTHPLDKIKSRGKLLL